MTGQSHKGDGWGPWGAHKFCSECGGKLRITLDHIEFKCVQGEYSSRHITCPSEPTAGAVGVAVKGPV